MKNMAKCTLIKLQEQGTNGKSIRLFNSVFINA